VRQARLARPRRAAAADHPRRAGASVRAAEGAQAQQPGRRLLGDQGVDLGHRDRLRQAERRQDPRQPAGEHGLPRAGRSEEEEVVAPRRRHLQRPLRRLLPAHLGEVGRSHHDVGGEGGSGDGRHLGLSRQMLDRLGEAPQPQHRDGFERRRFGGVGRRQQDLLEAQPAPEVGDGEAAAHRADGAVEAELAADQPAGQGLLRDLLVGREHRQGDSEVEVVPLLAEVGGSEIDDDGLGFQVEATVLDRGAHPLAALADCGIGEPHDLNLWESVVDVDLDLDGAGFDAPGGGGDGSG
jgi:hypothetical protein